MTTSTGKDPSLFLTDEQLLLGIEAMFFAYRGFTSDPDRILEEYGYGRAHHRALHFINRKNGLTVTELLAILGVTKQSLNRVLRQLIDDGLVESHIGMKDRRERNLYLSDKGSTLEKKLSHAQRARMRRAYKAAGQEAVLGFRTVLNYIMEEETRSHFQERRD